MKPKAERVNSMEERQDGDGKARRFCQHGACLFFFYALAANISDLPPTASTTTIWLYAANVWGFRS